MGAAYSWKEDWMHRIDDILDATEPVRRVIIWKQYEFAAGGKTLQGAECYKMLRLVLMDHGYTIDMISTAPIMDDTEYNEIMSAQEAMDREHG